MHRRLALILISVGGIGSLYLLWVMHRVSWAVLVDDAGWPRPFPYPDGWLAALHDWFDTRNPAPPGNVKLHGEFSKVRLTVGAIWASCLPLMAWGLKWAAAQPTRRVDPPHS
jgi:hypothetical protein